MLEGIVGVAGWALMWLALATSWNISYGGLVLAAFLQGHRLVLGFVLKRSYK
jgi:hypothetical protein